MPGMMGGGLGGMLGGMVRGGVSGFMGGGMGGMRGGMGGGPGGMGGGPGGMGGMNGGMGQQMYDGSGDMFDVDRWKRADDTYQYGAEASFSYVNAVRQDYNNKKRFGKIGEKFSKTRIGKRIEARKKKKEYDPNRPIYPGHAGDEPMDRFFAGNKGEHIRPRSNETKKNDIRKHADEAFPVKDPLTNEPVVPGLIRPDLGVGAMTFHHFFTSNPVNSIILSGDCLSTGPLMMNQVVKNGGKSFDTWSHDSKTGYMDGLKEQKNDKKYTVRIVNPDGV